MHYAGRISSRRHPGQHYSRLGDRARLLCRHSGRLASGPRPEPDLQIRERHRPLHISGCAGRQYVDGRPTRAKNRLTIYKRGLHADNNRKLNRNMTKEMVFSSRWEGAPPPPRPDIASPRRHSRSLWTTTESLTTWWCCQRVAAYCTRWECCARAAQLAAASWETARLLQQWRADRRRTVQLSRPWLLLQRQNQPCTRPPVLSTHMTMIN